MNNYALDTPVKRNLYIPDDNVQFAPVITPPPLSETDNSHRNFTWLHHKPRDHAVFPVDAKSGRLEKKK